VKKDDEKEHPEVEELNERQRRISPLWRRLLRALPIIALVSLLTLVLDHYGWLRSFETAALDRFFILKEHVPASDVVLVQIDDQDYQQLFHETSPLDPLTLGDIIDSIAKNQPRLIAVDIDTSANVFKDMKISSSWPPVIWARGAHQAVKKSSWRGMRLLPTKDEGFVLEGVLGKTEAPASLSTGIALMPLDSDSQIRRLQRDFPIADLESPSSPKLRVDSFHWAVVRKYCELASGDKRCAKLVPSQSANSDGGNLILNLAIDPYAFDPPIKASRVLDESRTGNVSGSPPVFLSLKDKIVILGGRYNASSDYYETLTGTKYGIDLTAIAVESELSGTGLRGANSFTLIILEALAGLVLVVFNFLFPLGWKHLIALMAIPLVALLGSFIAFSSLALWINFVPTLLATQLHVLYDKLAEAKLLQKEVLVLRGRLTSYEHATQSHDEDSAVSEDSRLEEPIVDPKPQIDNNQSSTPEEPLGR
jgi:CHASE2 domain-containing sensor protein